MNEYDVQKFEIAVIAELQKYKERYLFLEQFITIDDVGDEFYVPGIVVNWEQMEEKLSLEKPDSKRNHKLLWQSHDDTVLNMVDRAIKEHGIPK